MQNSIIRSAVLMFRELLVRSAVEPARAGTKLVQ
jgi:hypothetical protein